jgi:4-amino-4-deoxy-L-arabinose transferase-like glycosyltransferase
MEAAKNMLQKGQPLLCEYIDFDKTNCYEYPKSIGWPVLIAIDFRIFGVDNWNAIALSVTLGSLSVFLVFLLAYLLLDSEGAALTAAFITALWPLHITWSATAETVVPSLFFVLLALVLLCVYFRTSENIVLLLASLALAITIQMRVENILALPLITLLFACKGFKKDMLRRNLWLALSPMVIGLLLYIPQLNLAVKSNNEIYKQAYFSAEQIAQNIGFGVRIVTLDTGFWLGLLVTGIALLGFFFLLRDNKRVALFLAAWFLLFFGFYLSFVRMQARMLMLPIISLVLLLGYFLHYVRRKSLATAVMMHVFLIFVLVFGILAIPEMPAYTLETRIPKIAQKIVPKDCYIIAEWPTVLMSTTDLRVVSTRNVMKPKVVENLINTACVLYFEDGYCLRNAISEPQGSQQRCLEIHSRYNLSEYARFKESNVTYTFYRMYKR